MTSLSGRCSSRQADRVKITSTGRGFQASALRRWTLLFLDTGMLSSYTRTARERVVLGSCSGENSDIQSIAVHTRRHRPTAGAVCSCVRENAGAVQRQRGAVPFPPRSALQNVPYRNTTENGHNRNESTDIVLEHGVGSREADSPSISLKAIGGIVWRSLICVAIR